ncbi:prephenate dehydrogenase/arogenate dehydrogenase family protein [Luteolibacter pohnpeiensis]|uniref:Prephenate dehydrogenase/arogenate dehydrogenase family protein n=1 Tax=Luteolibacter pohnpeiensis TaxID=454153 RepID=A0A934S3F0_9BACT|nr:prephenate dehydrogenase/arogenate dehydrogenase family protein [Luteolibacter pohnpeiensis]MBK1882460.1 prephenate dehydrogenase/arogenate dehydrogenase family protein [Luteolibacter pohnpeiensis]
MTSDFQKITILGAGVLGGSLALATNRLAHPPAVSLWARRADSVDEALRLGLSHATTDLKEAISAAELLVLAVPVGVMPDLVKAAVESGLPDSCLITDVGSVKSTPHESLAPLLAELPNAFIGSHPMAGSEQTGLGAATSDLFEGAACILTNDSDAPGPAAEKLERFWKSVGCRTTWMGALAHDELVAKISHLPHILAASAARICLKDHTLGDFSGGGLRDTTRIASGNPSMWAEILTENRQAIIGPLRETIDDLREILATLEAAELETAQRWLSTAKQQRDTLAQSR